MNSNLKDGFKAALKIIEKNKITAVLLMIGVLLLILPEFTNGERQNDAEVSVQDDGLTVFSLEETEKKLEDTLAEISGIGEVRVMLTLKTGVEKILAQDESSSLQESGTGETAERREEKETSVVIVDGGEEDKAITVKYIYPEYMGAIVVAQGASSATVKLEIIQAVASVTGLPIGNITVLTM